MAAGCCPFASKAAALLLQRLLFFFPPHSDADLRLSSYVIGDKSILQDAGVKDLKDVEASPPPPEVSDKIPAQQYKGDVSYFICTRPGKDPVVLCDESKALLNPETWYIPSNSRKLMKAKLSSTLKLGISQVIQGS